MTGSGYTVQKALETGIFRRHSTFELICVACAHALCHTCIYVYIMLAGAALCAVLCDTYTSLDSAVTFVTGRPRPNGRVYHVASKPRLCNRLIPCAGVAI